ncbi:2-oxoglutarate dehydrogenase complex dihydrolipoyllysine-residue succinyltransferase [Candidatus Albibeggiatoa sp. nov. BB20]|uniref:2-oxoglutarate dehydrogenase complex dihydrolipoyllysine-residue succinyltransferase n=1 Tax=Candidatus Albibeggiatoa sp. nov. BB20 TaxID=3162723 RepID=UPI0033652F26
MSIEEVKVPVLAESVADATLLEWYKNVGEAVAEGDQLVDIETDKVVLEVVANSAGVLTEIVKENGSGVLSEELIARIDTAAAAPVAQAEVAPVAEAASGAPKTSPAVRKIANEQGVNPASVPHSGDRVTKTDMLKAAATPAAAPMTGRTEERVPMTRLRKRVAERLLGAQQQHAILTTFNEVNMKPMMDLRSQYKEEFQKKHDVKLGFMSFFAKAAVAALQQFPIINASTEGDEIIYHGFYDIGIAVSSPRGLVVPILRDVDSMSFADVEGGIADFGKRARDAKLSIDDLTGGTFTITNGGIFGSMMSTPILNPPQSAILGMHNTVERAVVENGEIVIRPMMYLALSYDHRIIDGRDAVQFLVAIKKAVEDPARLLLEL